MADQNALDASTFLDGDLDPTFAPISGRRAIAERVMRRWLTDVGTVQHALEDGENIRNWLSSGMTPKETDSLAQRLKAEAIKDEGVVDIEVVVRSNSATRAMTISGEITDADGPFPFTLAIDAVSASLVIPGAA